MKFEARVIAVGIAIGIVLKTELQCKSAELDNIAQAIYLFNVGLRDIYSVLSFMRNKANILSFTFSCKKLFSKICGK